MSIPTGETGSLDAVLVANGPLAPEAADRLRRAAAAARLVVGVDGGTRHLIALGLRPDLVTGDFDSLPADVRDDLAAQGVEIVATPDQDYTDLDKALAHVINVRGCRSIRVFAATGGRLDHLYSVLSALVKYGSAADVRLVDEIAETFRVTRTAVLSGKDLPGRALSLLALGTATRITTTGVRWPLDNEALAPGFRDGTLNVITEETATIEHHGVGHLLVYLHHTKMP